MNSACRKAVWAPVSVYVHVRPWREPAGYRSAGIPPRWPLRGRVGVGRGGGTGSTQLGQPLREIRRDSNAAGVMADTDRRESGGDAWVSSAANPASEFVSGCTPIRRRTHARAGRWSLRAAASPRAEPRRTRLNFAAVGRHPGLRSLQRTISVRGDRPSSTWWHLAVPRFIDAHIAPEKFSRHFIPYERTSHEETAGVRRQGLGSLLCQARRHD
jgi:hypothetical protein